ncbi:hypothetical protein BGY98DRAFT_720026 [Russula aff. rugulosa BPL654]|nr:hypothetical protein BGY98DRAFT_720026 [Russula aff. rugulosa BPL654]
MKNLEYRHMNWGTPREAFKDQESFLLFLNVKLPPECPPVPNGWSRGKDDFLESANMVAKFIRDQNFPERDALVFRNTEHRSPLGHVTDTACRPDITAALEGHWKKGTVHWPFICLAGKTASVGESRADQKQHAFSYLHCLLLARPDLYVAQGLLLSSLRRRQVTFLFGIGGEGIRQFDVKWDDQDLNKLLYAFIYRLYEPGDFADPSYIKTEFDKETTAKYTIEITYPGGTKECPGFYSIYARNPFATRTHVLSNPNFKFEDNDLTILKDQFCRVERRFEELTILNEYVHKPEGVPGVVVAAYGKQIKPPLSEERCKHRLGLRESGSHFMSIPTLSKVLETLFDVLEVLRYLRLYRGVLHRDISSGNVLFVEDSSNRSLPPNSVSVPPGQEAETNGLPLCYAKYLLGKSDNPLETSMLLVDFNVAEHLEPETSVKQIHRTGTPMFIARAVERGEHLPPVYALVPEIPNYPDPYAKVHPDRVKIFPGLKEEIIINPKRFHDKSQKSQPERWRHELEHDTESVFWLLLNWAMVVQPENCPKETIDLLSWLGLTGKFDDRDSLVHRFTNYMPTNLTHSFYKPLQPLIKDLAAILVIDSHWLKAPDPRKDTFYVTEAFQRLILKFMIENRGKEFMDRPIEKAFREVERAHWQHSNANSTTGSEKFDAANRLVNSSATDDIEMADDMR